MGNKNFYDPKDVPQFQQDECLKKCPLKGKCIDDGQNDHWFLMCPMYHKWKLGYTSFVFEQLEWAREHPEEAAAKQQAKVEAAKKWKAEQKAKAKAEKKAKTNSEKKDKK